MTSLLKKDYPSIKETLHYGQLANGLRVYLIKREGYSEKTAMLTAHFGSLDTSFTVGCQRVDLPPGVAHFLEHKLFEDKDGNDIALTFTQLGSETNAFTTFDKTSYFFSTVNEWQESLRLLQEFVAAPSFTEESVNREKHIITQEIEMYQDDPDYQAYSGILQNLFPNTSLAIDIAGTKESIRDITGSLLADSHAYFYHPSNMVLTIIGDIDIEAAFTAIEVFQDSQPSQPQHDVQVAPLIYHPVIKSRSIDMDIATAKLAVGFRGQLMSSVYSLLTYQVALKLLLAMLLGWTSKAYQDWYEKGKIDDSFDIEVDIQRDFQFVLISSDTSQPIAMSNSIRKKISDFRCSRDINEEHLELVKKEMYGDFMQSLDAIDQLASQFSLHLSEQETYFDIPRIIEILALKDIIEIGSLFFEHAAVSDFTVFPK